MFFVFNNGKDDCWKYYHTSVEGIFVGGLSSSKAYRLFNKRTLCIEESVHVIFDEDSDLKNLEMKDEDYLNELFNVQNKEVFKLET